MKKLWKAFFKAVDSTLGYWTLHLSQTAIGGYLAVWGNPWPFQLVGVASIFAGAWGVGLLVHSTQVKKQLAKEGSETLEEIQSSNTTPKFTDVEGGETITTGGGMKAETWMRLGRFTIIPFGDVYFIQDSKAEPGSPIMLAPSFDYALDHIKEVAKSEDGFDDIIAQFNQE